MEWLLYGKNNFAEVFKKLVSYGFKNNFDYQNNYTECIMMSKKFWYSVE